MDYSKLLFAYYLRDRALRNFEKAGLKFPENAEQYRVFLSEALLQITHTADLIDQDLLQK